MSNWLTRILGISCCELPATHKDTQEYPCRCGVTHRGDYAVYDYGHHNCFHEAELMRLTSDKEGGLSVMCPDCGKVWGVEKESIAPKEAGTPEVKDV